MKIRPERFVLVLYLMCLIALLILYGWSTSRLNEIEASRESKRPHIETSRIYVHPTKEVKVAKVKKDIIEETEEEIIEEIEELHIVETILTAKLGRVQGPIKEETYYNLPMDNVIQTMRNKGYAEEDYPYWVREDGVKMLGDFIIVATNLEEHPRGSVVQTSLGQGLICDECEHGEEFDIAVEW